MKRVRFSLKGLLTIAVASFTLLPRSNFFHASSNGEQADDVPQDANQRLPNFESPAGNLPDSQHVPVGRYDGAVIPNGRLITPAGIEVSVAAPKAFGMALSPDGKTLATVNSGIGPFSISLIHDLQTLVPSVVFINVNARFMGITFSSDSSRFFASGGENGNVWVGDPVAGLIVGSVNLNGPTHPLTGPLDVTRDPPGAV